MSAARRSSRKRKVVSYVDMDDKDDDIDDDGDVEPAKKEAEKSDPEDEDYKAATNDNDERKSGANNKSGEYILLKSKLQEYEEDEEVECVADGIEEEDCSGGEEKEEAQVEDDDEENDVEEIQATDNTGVSMETSLCSPRKSDEDSCELPPVAFLKLLGNQNTNTLKMTFPVLRENVVFEKIDSTVQSHPTLDTMVQKIQDTTGIADRKLIYAAVLILLVCVVPLLLKILLLLLKILTVVYPMFTSVKVIQANKKRAKTRWLKYWVLYVLASLVEAVVNLVLHTSTVLAIIKYAFMLWCMMPIRQNGSIIAYCVLQIVVLKRMGMTRRYKTQTRKKVEKLLNDNRGVIKQVVTYAGTALVFYNVPFYVSTLLCPVYYMYLGRRFYRTVTNM